MDFGKRCKELGVGPSMDSVGDAYDNSMAESFFASLECELIDRRSWKSFAGARVAIFTWIEGRYNPRRRHSGIGQKSPIKSEKELQDKLPDIMPAAAELTSTGELKIQSNRVREMRVSPTPTPGIPCIRRRRSVAHATRRALEEFPGGVDDARHLPAQGLAAVLTLGVMVPPRICAAHAKAIKAKELKAARTAATADKRRDARTAQVEARRVQAEPERRTRALVLRVAKAAATVAAKKAGKAAETGAEKAPAGVPLGVLSGCGLAR